MLDSDETPISQAAPAEIDSEPTAQPAKKATRSTARRKATATTPPEKTPTEDGATPAPRKRSPRKASAPALAIDPPIADQAQLPADPAEVPVKAAKKSSRSRKVTAVEPVAAPAVEAESIDTATIPAKATKAAKGAGTKATKSRPTKTAKSAELGGSSPFSNPSQVTDPGAAPAMAAPSVLFQAPIVSESAVPALATPEPAPRSRGRKTAAQKAADLEAARVDAESAPVAAADIEALIDDAEELEGEEIREAAIDEANVARRRRRRGRRGRGRQRDEGESSPEDHTEQSSDDAGEPVADQAEDETDNAEDASEDGGGTTASRRRRRRRRADSSDDGATDDPPNTVVHVRERRSEGRTEGGRGESSSDDGVRGVKGSTRLEAKRQRRRDGRDSGRRRPSILSEAEFLARRESVDRIMAVRQAGDRTQIAVLEDGVLVEHYVTRASATSYVGNVYLGRVQNVLPSMEAAFIDIGKGRNGVLYAGEVNWDAAGLEGKSRTIEHALNAGDSVLVQVTKDPIGHKGARLTSQVSLPGRFLVYVPGGGMTGISRKLPDVERQRLKAILKKIVPEDAGVIIRTAAEGATEEELTHDVERLKAEWESISAKSQQKKNAPVLLHGEPDLATRVVRDVFNEDFKQLIVQGDEAWQTVSSYLADVAPDLAERASRHTKDTDLFHDLRVDEGLAKALDRKVWLPSGGSLVIDRTEAMTVVDVNTGKYIGSGGNLEQTVTRNNLEAAEEIVRQLRLRDVGGIVVIDFIDMVLESNRDLVLRRLTECLGRDRTKHQVAEVTSLGLVQMTRKRVGEGLLEAFSEPCEVCRGRGVIIHSEPVDQRPEETGSSVDDERPAGRKRGGRRGSTTAKPVADEPVHVETPEEAERRRAAATAMAAIHRAAAAEAEEAGALPIPPANRPTTSPMIFPSP